VAGGRFYSLVDYLRRRVREVDRSMPDDAVLLDRFDRERDVAAFELLVWRHGPMVLSLCGRILRDAQLAEDAFQATFLTLVRKASTVSKRHAVGAWLYKVASRTALRARRMEQKRASLQMPLEQVAARVATTDDSWSDSRPVLDEEISRLPRKYCLPVVLCHIEGRTLAEAASILGWPRGTVAVRLARARALLRRRLVRRGITLSAGMAAVLAVQKTVSAELIQRTVRGVIACTTGGVAATGVISGSVLSLSKGVMRSMLLSKIKIGAAVLAATVAVGSSAGWVAQRGGAGESQTSTIGSSEPSRATPLVSANTVTPTASGDEERDRLVKKLVHAQTSLTESEEHLAKTENALADELIEARLRFAEAQEKLKGIETDLGRRINEIATETSNQVADVQLSVRMITEKLAQLRQATGTTDQPKMIARLERELNQLQDKVRESEHRRQQLLGSARSQASAEARAARRELVVAEEALRRLERRRDREIGRAEQRVRTQAAQVDRLQTLVNDQEATPAPPTNQKLSDLESKVDQILQELQEIRRSGKRQSSDPLERK
jgi:RNA polymerase sigma factor (sigma-70 family)